MTAGLDTADAHQALALATEKATNARRDLICGLDEMRSAAVALDLDDLVDDIGPMAAEAIVATIGLSGIKVDVVAALSLRISQHRTHEVGVLA